jgi:trans-aconitate methyltransferase
METNSGVPKVPDGDELVALLRSPSGSDPFDHYLRFHAERISYLLRLLHPLVADQERRRGGQVRLLDVGPGHLTAALHYEFGTRLAIDTLGWRDDRVVGVGMVRRHVEFDLNDAQHVERWASAEPHDVVVLAEVLEHLYTAPSLVLACLACWVEPGGVLVVQTPNAVSLRKRVKLAVGRHPYEQIREDRTNPGHFREYTAGELVGLLGAAGFDVEATIHASYWRRRLAPGDGEGAPPRAVLARQAQHVADRVVSVLEDAYPPFRQGLTVVARRRAAPGPEM